MAKHIVGPNKQWLNKILAYSKQHLPKKDPQHKLILKFIELYFSHTCEADFDQHGMQDLFGAAISHWKLFYKHKPHELKIKIFNPTLKKDGWESTHTVIEVVSKDMPFIIDSMRMELNRLGVTTHLVVHTGGIKVVRDAKGQVLDLKRFSADDQKAIAESPIYMEIDRQTDPKFLTEIKKSLQRVLSDVHAAVKDWQPMRARLGAAITELERHQSQINADELAESVEFLNWLLQEHFTFLGARDYTIVKKDDRLALKLLSGSGLGVLSDDTQSRIYREIDELPEQARALMLSKKQVLIISKTNTLSTVHRPTYTDLIVIKQFNPKGELIGVRHFIGLYTSSAYSGNPKYIPFLRKKVDLVLKRSALPPRSHGGKDLMHILSTLPRDDLFQATVDELYDLSMGILHLQERRKIRLFTRVDAYGRFVSCLVYLPRENFTTRVVDQMQAILKDAFHGLEVSFFTHFSESVLARTHFIIRIDPKRKLRFNLKKIEQRLIDVGKSWNDGLRENIQDYFGEERGNQLFLRYENAFPAGYREVFLPRNAIYDIDYIEKVVETNELGISFYRPLGASKDVIMFKLYNVDHTIPLSDAMPMLENMGLRVIGEVPYRVRLKNNREVWINDFSMTYVKETRFELEKVKHIFQEAFNKIWLGEAENDAFNRLVLEAELTWREIALIRAYAKYLRQTGFTFSPEYIAETFVNNPAIARSLIELFKYYFQPSLKKDRRQNMVKLEEKIIESLEAVASLDEDRILRRCLKLIKATLRTNYFQLDKNKQPKPYLSFKFDPEKVPELPLPLPRFEIFVYSPRFEGLHLRSGKVARGGIRWSDRREDFRTEILGLMKAQQVKNAVIVPAGAKGGFVAKCLPVDASREAILEEGIYCYRGFISGLLDLTDNLEGRKIIKPPCTVCYDEDDPYLVVAADKGTATFSDIANSIAIERGFWLGDAFASGGSTGYDHKRMGITARGAWVSAERQFQELGINVDETEVSVVGIGDMSGDVFGNGLLMTKKLKVVAAFNHMHIFLDPNPDLLQSYKERKRLFDLPRSTWDDYNRELLSKGGGVYKRSVKKIAITPEVKSILKIKQDSLTPNALIKAILKAPVDLIWNGGIGTFVKAKTESHGDAGDRTNDAIRINGSDLRARVVVEGGNLGLTQLGRVEYELKGGYINTDFIDNSAGVDCSDHEVNIKILLNSVVEHDELTLKQRNNLLARMTKEVGQLVLRNNYHQNEGISFASYASPKRMGVLMSYMDWLEDNNLINRELEFLPDNKTMLERRAAGLGLARPELAVLFAYTKIILERHIRKSELIKDPYLSEYMKNAFPTPLVRRYSAYMEKHRLRDEIISTQLSNYIVSNMGITFAYQMNDETGAPISAIVRAFAVTHKIFNMDELYKSIESLDYIVDPHVQHEMNHAVIRMVRRATRWFLRNRRVQIDIVKNIELFGPYIKGLTKRLPKLLTGGYKTRYEQLRDDLITVGVSESVATSIASCEPLYHTLNIIEAAVMNNADVYQVAKIYFMLVERLDLLWFRDQINAYPVESRWAVLAKAAYKGDLDWVQRKITIGVLNLETKAKTVDSRINAWMEKHRGLIDRWCGVLADLRSAEIKDFAILSVATRELSDLAQTAAPDLEKPSAPSKRKK